jgi:hypothetical protein
MDCGEATAVLGELLQARVDGLTRVTRRPPTGWRDGLALYATVFGSLGAGVVGEVITGSWFGALVAPAVALFGYKKQFWKMALRRRARLDGVPARERPTGEALIGTAHAFERTVGGDVLAVATTIESSAGVVARAIDAAPFWLALPDRRVLVTGECWLAGPAYQRNGAVSRTLGELGAKDLPIAQARGKRLWVVRVKIAPGDRIAVIGRIREEQLAGAGGYRDALVETVRGEAGAPVWIDRLDRGAAAPSPAG